MTQITKRVIDLVIRFLQDRLRDLSTRTIATTLAVFWFVVLSLISFAIDYWMGNALNHKVLIPVIFGVYVILVVLSAWLEPYWYYFVWLPLWYWVDTSAGVGIFQELIRKILFWVDWSDKTNAERRRIYFSIPRVLQKSALQEHQEAWDEFFNTPDKYGETRWQKLSDVEQRYPMIARAVDVFERKDFLHKAKWVFGILLLDGNYSA